MTAQPWRVFSYYTQLVADVISAIHNGHFFIHIVQFVNIYHIHVHVLVYINWSLCLVGQWVCGDGNAQRAWKSVHSKPTGGIRARCVCVCVHAGVCVCMQVCVCATHFSAALIRVQQLPAILPLPRPQTTSASPSCKLDTLVIRLIKTCQTRQTSCHRNVSPWF